MSGAKSPLRCFGKAKHFVCWKGFNSGAAILPLLEVKGSGCTSQVVPAFLAYVSLVIKCSSNRSHLLYSAELNWTRAL